MKLRHKTILAVALPAALLIAGCQRNADETAGQDIDRRMAEAGRQVDQTPSMPSEAQRARDAAGTTSPMAGANNMSEEAITAAVKAELMKEPTLSAVSIDADGSGQVTLKGEVENAAAKERAEQLARNARGVRNVDNQLVVKSA